MRYTIDSAGIQFYDEEIPIPEAVAEMERISARLEAALNPDAPLTDDQRERIRARIMDQCECAATGARPCGMCEG